jgi:hypothetical protein
MTDAPPSRHRRATEDDLRRHDEDIISLRRVQDELKDDWSPLTELTPQEVVRAWIAIVAIVEVGYDGMWEEYTLDLMTREYIDELCRRLPGRWSLRFADWIGPWDERFRAATVEESTPHFPSLEGEHEPGWWWYRTPRVWPGEH